MIIQQTIACDVSTVIDGQQLDFAQNTPVEVSDDVGNKMMTLNGQKDVNFFVQDGDGNLILNPNYGQEQIRFVQI